MTPTEAQVLLTMAAAFDNRKPDPDAAKAWAAALDGLRLEDCRQVLIEHYRRSTDWLMPAMIRTAVVKLRRKRIDEHPPIYPPPGLTDAEERKWLAGAWRAIGDGQTYDPASAYELTEAPRELRELIAAATPTATTEESTDE